jgi:hypothetical protein
MALPWAADHYTTDGSVYLTAGSLTVSQSILLRIWKNQILP